MNRRRCARILSGMFLASLLALPAQALTLEQARTLLTDAYIDPVPQEVLDQTSISAMLEQLGDRYTQYFTAEEYQAFLSSMEDASLVGIGVVSIAGTDGMTITSVLEGSPAQAAGLREGDRIVAVDGRSTLGVDAAQVSSWIQGEAGTQVTVTYQRGEEKHTVTLTRAAITVPTTTSRLVEGRVGYLECTTFGTDTYPHIQEGISAYQDEARVWVMDLRGNGGGLTSAASQAVSAFTDAQNTGYLRDGSGSYGAFSSSLSPLTDKAVIVLSDGYTASSSELFSACIRDLNAGIVVGGRTFGKGVAQTLFDQSVYPDYFPDGDAMKITTNRYFSPAGATTDTVGIIPHLLVDPDLADEVAILLSAAPPDGDTAGYYRLDLGWRWYIDGEQASSPAYRDAFAQLLSAIPPHSGPVAGDRRLQRLDLCLPGRGRSDLWPDLPGPLLLRHVGQPLCRVHRPAGLLSDPLRHRGRDLPSGGLSDPGRACHHAGRGPQLQYALQPRRLFRRVHGQLVWSLGLCSGAAGSSLRRRKGEVPPR